MAITQGFDTPGTAPDRTDRTTFSTRMAAAFAYLYSFIPKITTWTSQANALAVNVSGWADTAETAADDATAAAQAAAQSAACSVWVTGTTYAVGDVRWSPIDFQSYRRNTNGAGSTDPSSDTTNWSKITLLPEQTGKSGNLLTTDGSAPSWVAKDYAGFSNLVVFTNSGSWTVPAGITRAKVICINGGQGGGTSPGSGGSTSFAGSGLTTLSGATNGALHTGAPAGQGTGQLGGGITMLYAYGRGGSALTGSVPNGSGGNTGIKVYNNLTPGATITVTIGDGGTAGTNGTAGTKGVCLIEY
jgi:hypothetical protein